MPCSRRPVPLRSCGGTLYRNSLLSIDTCLQRYSRSPRYALGIAGYVVAAGAVTTVLSPSFGRLFKREQELEGAGCSRSSALDRHNLHMLIQCIRLHVAEALPHLRPIIQLICSARKARNPSFMYCR